MTAIKRAKPGCIELLKMKKELRDQGRLHRGYSNLYWKRLATEALDRVCKNAVKNKDNP